MRYPAPPCGSDQVVNSRYAYWPVVGALWLSPASAAWSRYGTPRLRLPVRYAVAWLVALG